VIPALAALIAIQKLDTAADIARKRLADLPAQEAALSERVAEATGAVEAVKAGLAENQTARRALEKDVAAVDTRTSRFNDHKAQVKTNQEYTALLHEIETAKTEKDALEEKILVLMEAADVLGAEQKAAEAALAKARREADTARADMKKESQALEEELRRLDGARKGELAGLEGPVLVRYEQLLKNRKGVAVAAMQGETCTACFVRLRPHIAQQIRRNDEIVQCESCQRILYYDPPPDAPAAG
jgi:predicted  nucleic acid-binding Zn-ribbon protein